MTASIWAPNGFAPDVIPLTKFEYTATAAQTVFSIAPFTVLSEEQLEVFTGPSEMGEINRTTLYSVVGTDVIFASGLSAGTFVRINVYREIPADVNNIPSPAGHSGEFLTNDGLNLLWGPPPSTDFTQTGTGAVTRTITSKLQDVFNVFDFLSPAEKADVQASTNTIDISAKIQNAVTAAAGGVLIFSKGSYSVGSSVNIPANTTLVGYGATIYTSATGVVLAGAAFKVASANVVILGFSFDLGMSRLPVYASYAIRYNLGIDADGSTNLKVQYCRFFNLYTQAIQMYNANSFAIINNKFLSPVQTQMLLLEHIWVLTCIGNMLIEGNEFTNDLPPSPNTGVCGIFISGTQDTITVKDNVFKNCGRNNAGSHRLGVIDCYGNSSNVHIVNNLAWNCLAQFMRMADVQGGEVTGNQITYSNLAEVSGTSLSIESTATFIGVANVGCRSLKIHANEFTGNTDSTRFGITVNSYDYGIPSTDISIYNNSFHFFAVPIQVNGPFNSVKIKDNYADGSYGSTISQQYTGNGITLTSLNGVTQAQSSYQNLVIEGNVIRDSGTSNRNGIALDMTKSGGAYTGTVGSIQVLRNKIQSVNANSSQGISVNMICATPSARLLLYGNEAAKYAYSYYVRNCLDAEMDLNVSVDHATGAFLEDGSNVHLQTGILDTFVGGVYTPGPGETGAIIFANPDLLMYGVNDPTIGPPVGVTTPGSCIRDSVITYPESLAAFSMKGTTSGTSIGNGCTISPGIQPWRGTSTVAISTAVYAPSLTRRIVVHFYDGVSYKYIGETSLATTWQLITGVGTPIQGNNWAIVYSLWDGVNYYSGFNWYCGGLSVHKGRRPAATIDNSIARQTFNVFASVDPTLAPDRSGQLWFNNITNKVFAAKGATSPAEWILLN